MMTLLILSTVFAFCLGAILGSFLNVVIYRVPAGESVVHPPSHCPVCNNGIAWYDNIPILSWLFLGGQCRHCGTSISPRYIMIEGLTGFLAALCWLRVGFRALKAPANSVYHLEPPVIGAIFLMYLVFVCVCVTLAFIDLDHLIVPHSISIQL